MLEQEIQNVLCLLDSSAFARWLRFVLLALVMIGLGVVYDLTNYHNFSSPEAMDAAQVARHLAAGDGYATDFIRPFSLCLVQRHNQPQSASTQSGTNDFARINGLHPDLANAPLYPTVLAGLMKLHTPDWKVKTYQPFWTEGGHFMRYPPEFAIAIFNQILLMAAVVLTFFLARKLFDAAAAWLAALLLFGSALLWRFSVSGLSTLLVLVIFLGLAWYLVKIEELARAETPAIRKLFGWAVGAGLLVGAGMLTRYAFGWLLVPVVIFLWLFGGRRRVGLAGAAVLACGLLVSPWIVRNLAVSGTCFGTAGYAVVEGTSAFPGSRLMQSLNPDLTACHRVRPLMRKLMDNSRDILQGDLLRVGGGWVAIPFFTGLLLGLRNIAARRLRYFTLMCLGLFAIVQALGKTHLSSVSPDLNSENLLVLLTPLAVIFGVAFFLTLLDQMKIPSLQMRHGVIVLFAAIVCQPLIATQLAPKSSPVAYPPYYPPEIQQIAGWMKPKELLMSDIPWAVAWYGQRQCSWITLNSQYEFSQLNDYVKPVSGLYLTLVTLDGKLFSECLQGGVDSWNNFALKTVAANQIPKAFPLKISPYGLVSGLFLTDRQRWQTE
jgi:4-amino-4-deoxy-L-arabinose transferase-like glycosyltransferase